MFKLILIFMTLCSCMSPFVEEKYVKGYAVDDVYCWRRGAETGNRWIVRGLKNICPYNTEYHSGGPK